MSTPLEHDYIGIGLKQNPSMELNSEKVASSSVPSNHSSEDDKSSSLIFKETELRLGLPGSQSPDRKVGLGVSLFGKDLDLVDKHSIGYSLSPLKSLVSGAKRGFSDAIEGPSGKWVFSASDKSEVDLRKGASAASFSSRGGNNGKPLVGLEAHSHTPSQIKKEVGVVSKTVQEKKPHIPATNESASAPAAKAQVVGWPPIRSFRKNSMASNLAKVNNEAEGKPGFDCLYVKVSMDGAPYLRKVDLKTYSNYMELSSALEKMFRCFSIGQCLSHRFPQKDGLSESRLKDLLHGSEYVLTYEDRDGDWMLVGDVPWEMFTDSCRRLRVIKGSEAIGLAPRAMEKSKEQN